MLQAPTKNIRFETRQNIVTLFTAHEPCVDLLGIVRVYFAGFAYVSSRNTDICCEPADDEPFSF